MSPGPKRFRAILFDAGQTLVDMRPDMVGFFAELLADCGHEFEPARLGVELMEVARLDIERLVAGEAQGCPCSKQMLDDYWLGMNQRVFDRLGIGEAAHELAHEIERRFNSGHYMYAYEDVAETLAELRAKGYRLGVVSNATAGMANVLRVLGIERAVDFVIVSALAGHEKPGQPIFKMAIEQAGCAPSEILFIGDHYICDYEASRKAGITPLLINRAGREQPADVKQVRNLEELMPLLENGFFGS